MIDDLCNEVRKTVKKLGKDIRWLRYAQKQDYGYRILPDKNQQYQVLEAISRKISAKYPNMRMGEIADTLSYIVNK